MSSNIPYQAYKSKRHSRTLSNMVVPNVSPPPLSRPASVVGKRSNGAQPMYSDPERHPTDGNRDDPSMDLRPSSVPQNEVVIPIPTKAKENGGPVGKLSAAAAGVFPIPNQEVALSTSEDSVVEKPPASVREEVKTELSISTSVNGTSQNSVELVGGPSTASTPTLASATLSPAASTSLPRKSSSFRHVPLRSSAARSPMPSSPLRPPGTHSRAASTSSTSASRQFELPISTSHRPAHAPTQTQPRSRITSLASVQSSDDRPLPTIPSFSQSAYTERAASVPEPSPLHSPQPSSDVIVPPPRTHSLNAGGPKPPPKLSQSQSQQSQSSSHTSTPAASSPAHSPAPSLPHLPLTHTTVPTRVPAPYRPGFQPKGVYRPLTEEFASLRKTYRDVGRIERTKLERRLEKLIQLHFSSEAEKAAQLQQKQRPAAATVENRRASSFFDLDLSDLRNLDAGELWRGVLQSQAVQGGKADIRVAEQRITPWQDDASVSKCPLCTASFHPLTNRKHHCRLCGQIICSLPVKRPQRPETCSLLFVVDPKTRRIEEVGEGVDYGVRRRRSLPPPGPGQGKEKEKEEPLPEDEKFLKGVRICRQCRPVLLRQQYHQEVVHVPTFSRLYEIFINLEKEIEDSLPQFQELLLTLSHDDQPTKEASAARKRLLEAFAQYDALAKRIRKIPCLGGKGSSEDRVQLAILSRANLFLQKNMFPLQSLPKPKLPKSTKSLSSDDGPVIDPDSAVAHALQPLLEQEALLESFVEEAKAHRKFEDAKTLKTNLHEIRAEIDKIMVNAEDPIGKPSGRAKTSRK
ncbi:hypothetical protein PILCRDRAFT_815045 [Piloderma croceum F 1598]|uniref:FYVE-type domain-containing protein n=1 Tax=Piloderma croceum (strain F 1598) TaxID=765440 RepID=A0A0C3FTD8_PILCF|nr:hypothetical protein PILCRDRAFT_815045 [Piloderma croceum F 1598]